MKVNFFAILVYVAAASSALLSFADVLPKSWLPFIVVIATVTQAFTPRAAKRGARTSPPQAGRGQRGRIRLSALFAGLALCLSLLLLTGCPKQQSGAVNTNANVAQSKADKLQKRAKKAAEVLDHSASDIQALAAITGELRADGIITDAAARDIEKGLLDANGLVAEGAGQALSYGSLDEFARAGLVAHIGKLRKALAGLNERGTLHIKNNKSRATFAGILIAADLVLSRYESDAAEPIPEGVTYTLDATIRRLLERARDQAGRNDKKLREDLAPVS